MSVFDLSGHDVLALEAVHCHGDSCHWIDLTLKGAGDQEMMWSLFFRGPHAEAAVRIYVDAINEATRKIGELQLPIEAPPIVAERCRGIVEHVMFGAKPRDVL